MAYDTVTEQINQWIKRLSYNQADVEKSLISEIHSSLGGIVVSVEKFLLWWWKLTAVCVVWEGCGTTKFNSGRAASTPEPVITKELRETLKMPELGPKFLYNSFL